MRNLAIRQPTVHWLWVRIPAPLLLLLYKFARTCIGSRGLAPTLISSARNLRGNKRRGAASHENLIMRDPQVLPEVM